MSSTSWLSCENCAIHYTVFFVLIHTTVAGASVRLTLVLPIGLNISITKLCLLRHTRKTSHEGNGPLF